MGAYDNACEVERDFLDDVVDFLRGRPDVQGAMAFPDGSRAEIDRAVQSYFGDLLWWDGRGRSYVADLKVEAEDKHGNFFLETWSNREWFKPGWMFYSRMDWLIYGFRDSRVCYFISFASLRRWAFGTPTTPGHIYGYPEKRQAKRDQRNDTWARCVPIAVILASVPGVKSFCIPTRSACSSA